jgi:putative transposase
LKAGLGRWITYYNTQRPHSGLAGKTPVEAYRRIGQSDDQTGGVNDNRD